MRIATIVLSALLLASLSLAAQAPSMPNKTGLPAYPHLYSGIQADQPDADDESGRSYITYTGQSNDSLPVVEAWYKKALPTATETPTKTAFIQGVEFTIGNDKVRVYYARAARNTIISLWKYVPGN